MSCVWTNAVNFTAYLLSPLNFLGQISYLHLILIYRVCPESNANDMREELGTYVIKSFQSIVLRRFIATSEISMQRRRMSFKALMPQNIDLSWEVLSPKMKRSLAEPYTETVESLYSTVLRRFIATSKISRRYRRIFLTPWCKPLWCCQPSQNVDFSWEFSSPKIKRSLAQPYVKNVQQSICVLAHCHGEFSNPRPDSVNLAFEADMDVPYGTHS